MSESITTETSTSNKVVAPPDLKDDVKSNDSQYDIIASKGIENGLYQASMKSIRKAHFHANRLRAGLVLAGLFTDVEVYREVLSLFYIITSTMELKLKELASEGDMICKKILKLGYNFTPQYESDLHYLYGDNWKDQVEACGNRSTIIFEYKEKIKSMNVGTEISGPCFVLWGALIIGGGAAVMPRIEKLCGTKKACNLFEGITGAGRAQRRKQFIEVWDSLVLQSDVKDFATIVNSVESCMQSNNDIFSSLQRNPWWLKYTIAATALFGVISVASIHLLTSKKRLA